MPELGERRINKYWDCTAAAYRYRLQIYHQTPHGMHQFWETNATGSAEWAYRNAQHFGITVQQDPEEE
jgi:hypothetical protein